MSRLTSIIVAIAVTGCGKGGGDAADERSDVDEGAAQVQVDAGVVSSQGGTVQALVSAASPNTQIVKGAAGGKLANARLAFPPACFQTDVTVELGDGKTIASTKNVQSLTDANTTAQAAGPAAFITWTYDEDSAKPFTVTLPAPAGSNLAVVAIKNVANSDARSLALVPTNLLQLGTGVVSFETQSYGLYQVVSLSKATSAAKQVATVEKPERVGAATNPPGNFAITAPTDALSGAKPKAVWDEATDAESYEVRVSASDPTCEKVDKTYADVTLTNQVIDAVADGDNYLCVTAKNAAGATKASNTGLKFQADKSPPPAPGKPDVGAPKVTTINFLVQWGAVTDTGPGGLAQYYLEVGHEPGGADVFTGPVVGTTQKGIIGFDGETYYARVKAIDGAGNESDWSPVSDGVLIDSK